MGYNGAGVYVPPSLPGSWNPAVSGQSATPQDWNTLLADFVGAFDNVICRDGQTTISQNIPFNNKRITGLGDAVALTDAVNAGQILDNGLTAADDTGAANAYVIDPAIAITAYAAYQWFQFKALNANTTASTLNVSSLGAKDIKRPNGDALVASDILAGAICDVMYDGTQFILMDGGSNAINYSMLTTRGDTIARGATKPQRIAPSAGGQAVVFNGTDTVFGVPAMRGYLWGLTLSTAGSSATFAIAAGVACDSTGVSMMTLASAYTKTTASWAVGTGNGSLDTGTIANDTVYHVWEIIRPDTGVVDILTSLSATAPTMPTNYTLKRRIGSMMTNGSAQWVAFIQNGDDFRLKTPVVDLNAVVPGVTTRVTKALTVPTGVVVFPDVVVSVADSSNNNVALLLTSLDETDTAPDGTHCHQFQQTIDTITSGTTVTTVHTNTSAQIGYRVNTTTAGVRLTTYGWIDTRGRYA